MKKQMTEKLKNRIPDNRGITLIALVITIIVMLILVAVTITMAVNGGLFEYAGNAGAQTNAAIDAEQQLANLQANMTVDELVDKYTDGTTEGITALAMQSDLATYLGKEVNYEVAYTDASSYGEGKWEIFYADEDHIYITTKGHLASEALSLTDKDGNAYNGTSDFTAENGLANYPAVAAGLFDKTYDPSLESPLLYKGITYKSATNGFVEEPNNNMKATQYLLDSTVWKQYAPETNAYADWAIGAPTMELFVKSYNTYYPDKIVTIDTPSNGSYPKPVTGYSMPLTASNSIPSGTYLNHSTGYWLACPVEGGNGYLATFGGGTTISYFAYNNRYPARPVVCLKSTVSMWWNEGTSQFELSIP